MIICLSRLFLLEPIDIDIIRLSPNKSTYHRFAKLFLFSIRLNAFANFITSKNQYCAQTMTQDIAIIDPQPGESNRRKKRTQ